MKRILLLISLLVASHICSAHFFSTKPTATTAVAAIQQADIQKNLQKLAPELIIEKIVPTALPGIYQVIADQQVFYSTADGNYFFHGNLLDFTAAKGVVNQTELVRQQIRQSLIATIAKKDLIIFSPKKRAKGFVTVFTDVDCVFCRHLHQEITKITDLGLEVRYAAFPRQGLGSDSYKKTVSIWCADDPKNMLTLAKTGATVPSKECGSPVADQYKLGQQLHIPGTPTLIFADGTQLAQYLPAAELVKIALQHQAKVVGQGK